jgi:hypothetical protein
VVIRFTEAADLSTFLHESGHLWLAQLEKDAREAGGQLSEDLEIVKAWLGTEDVFTNESQEKWARAMEAYYFEGKAPTAELQSVFQRFTAWLVRIYKRLRAIPGYAGDLNPEIRGVMDRLIASDEAIAETAASLGFEAMDAEALGMNEAEAKSYLEAITAGRVEASSAMQSTLMAELKRQKTKEWASLREAVRKDVEADVNARPVFQAQHWLSRGEVLPDQAEVPIPWQRLDRDALVSLFGKDILKVLPKGKFGLWGKEGLHPGIVADLFGFPDSGTLVRALSAAGRRLTVIEQETDAEMMRRHGKFETSEAIESAAMEALANEKQIRALLIEERALAKKAGGRVTPAQVARRAAERIVRNSSYRSLQPHRYRMASQKAAREAVELLAEGRDAEAQAAKRRQVVNVFMESEARKAQREANSALDYLNRVQSKKSRQKIGLAGHDYLEQIESMLERFDLRRSTSLRAIDRRKSLLVWIREQEEIGEAVVIPDKLRDEAFTTSWKELSINDLLGLRDSIQNIEHLSKLKNKFLANRNRRSMDAVRADLIANIEKNATNRALPKTINPRAMESFKRGLLAWDSPTAKLEFLARFLDGDDPKGHWTTNVIQPANDIMEAKLDMSVEFTEKLGKLIQTYIKPKIKEYTTDFYAPQIGEELNKSEVLMLALNWGNEGNAQRIVDGNGYQEGAVQSLLDEQMTREDWDFVEAVWSTLAELKPMLFEMERRLTGVAPPSVEGRVVQTPFGEIQGQYFPIVYDAEKSTITAKHAEQSLFRGLETGFETIAGRPGSAIERMAKVKNRPILLDMSVIPAHIDEIVHKVTTREKLIQLHKLLDNDGIRRAFQNTTLGDDYYKLWHKWLEDIATDRIIENRALGRWTKFLRHLRLGSTVGKLAIRETTLVGQALGHSNAIGILRQTLPNWQHWYKKGFEKTMAGWHPQRMSEHATRVMEESAFMRHRVRQLDRDVRDIRRRAITSRSTATGKLKTAIDEASDGAMQMIGWMQFASVDLPVWSAAYQGAVGEWDFTHEEAVRFADAQVRLSQGGGDVKDLSQIQRGDEMMKMWTLFFSYMNTVGNQIGLGSVRKVKSIADVPKTMGDLVYFLAIPAFGYAFTREILTGRGGPPDDAEDWTDYMGWATGLLIGEAMSTVPFLREANSLPLSLLGGGKYWGSEVPLQDLIGAINDLAHPQDTLEFFLDFARVVSPLMGGFPPDAALQRLEKLIEGEVSPISAVSPIGGAIDSATRESER